MKIIVRTLQNKQYPFEVTDEQTVHLNINKIQILDLKEQIKNELGHEVGLQKLIMFGKVMDDAKKFAELKVKDGDFMVLMVAKVLPGYNY